MYRVKGEEILDFVGKEVIFKFDGWNSSVRAYIVNEGGRYHKYNGRQFVILGSNCPAAIFLEEPEDECAYCGRILDDCCSVYVFAINKGKD